MISNVRITTNESRIRLFLGSTLPDGVGIASGAPLITKDFNLDVDVNFDISINLTKIAATAFAAWLASKLKSALSKPGVHVYVNGKQISEDEADTTKLIAYEVDSQARDDDEDD